MASCEKCWSEAGGDANRYHELLLSRENAPCSLEEQAGPDASVCPACGSRTVHQYAGHCLLCAIDGPPKHESTW